jgi:hypothetical protein
MMPSSFGSRDVGVEAAWLPSSPFRLPAERKSATGWPENNEHQSKDSILFHHSASAGM